MKFATESPFIPASLVRGSLLAIGRRIGNEVLNEHLLRDQHIPFSVLSNKRLSIQDFERLLAGLEQPVKLAVSPEQIGFDQVVKNLGPFGQAIITSPTWQHWFAIIDQFITYIGAPEGLIHIHTENDTLYLNIHASEAIPSSTRFFAGIIAKLFIVSCSGGTPFNTTCQSEFLQQQFQQLNALLSDESLPSLVLQLTFPTDAFSKKPRFANRRVHSVFSRELESTSHHNGISDLASRVQALLDSHTSLEGVTQQRIAEQLFMSERNLLRKLNAQGISFRELFNRVRSKRALDLLFTGTPICKIAQQLGYSERATFERAFKKWQGITPVAMQSRFSSLSAERSIEHMLTPEKIPLPNPTLLKLLGLLGDEESKIEELVNVVDSDPVLTTKVLSVANSSLYGYKGITSIKQAIMQVLGTHKLKAIVITFLSTDSFGHLPGWFSYSDFWFRSLGCAHVTQYLLTLTAQSESNRLDIYLAALLHNIGEIALAHCLAENMKELFDEGMNDLSWFAQLNLQKLRVGIHAVQVSEMVLNVWNFPEPVTQVLRQSSLCQNFIDTKLIDLKNVLVTASMLIVLFSENSEEFDHKAKNVIARYLGPKNAGSADTESAIVRIKSELTALRDSAENLEQQ